MNGVINFLKPPGMSSNHAVGFFKKLLNTKKVGHAGTLDPGASGVLVVLVGKATKLSDYFMSGGKTYLGEITFGIATDTQDAYGAVTERDDVLVSIEEVAAVLPNFIGEIEQTPSRYSAIKVDGKRAYDLARKGDDFQLKSRKIIIERLTLVKQSGQNRFLLEITCSKGTYIRALFEDIAKALGTCAYMSFLERTVSGRFSAVDAITMDEAESAIEENDQDRFLLPIEKVLDGFPAAIVKDSFYKRIANGLSGDISNLINDDYKGQYRIYCKDIFFGLGTVSGNKAKVTTHLLGVEEDDKHQI